MNPAELSMLIELALVVREMAPPDSQRRIDKALERMEARAMMEAYDLPKGDVK